MKELETFLKKPLLTLRLVARATLRRIGAAGEEGVPKRLSRRDFQDQWRHVLDRAPAQLFAEHIFFDVPADAPPWFDTQVDLEARESVTVFATGRVTLSSAVDAWVGPHVSLWTRVGAREEIFRGTRDANTFTTETGGRLSFASLLPGEWADTSGNLATPVEEYSEVSGGMTLLVVRWRTDPLEGLRQLAAFGDPAGLLAMEIDRLTVPISRPEGWEPLWLIGPTETFQQNSGGPIRCRTQADTAIVQKEVSAPLTPETRIRWSWKVDVLPSDFAEDSIPTHDYMSIAVEFDNGQDITYYWSAKLRPETSYRCPFPTWHDRETHVVVRSGTKGLGEWLWEERNLYLDYRRAIGTPPARIVGVWLIATSLFQRKEGRCEFADIELLSETGPILVAGGRDADKAIGSSGGG